MKSIGLLDRPLMIRDLVQMAHHRSMVLLGFSHFLLDLRSLLFGEMKTFGQFCFTDSTAAGSAAVNDGMAVRAVDHKWYCYNKALTGSGRKCNGHQWMILPSPFDVVFEIGGDSKNTMDWICLKTSQAAARDRGCRRGRFGRPCAGPL